MKRPPLRQRLHVRPMRGLPFNKMIPNILTLLALCAGMTAIRLALGEHYREAVVAIFVAAILDGIDGRIARLLKGTSEFGAELDSLSDFVSFGV
ncbi:MAG TPA: CDP-alcohol phosphatidyltransferase family protein, partial [Stellaceae bacterium]|nr:CDP-alcohol phosphatidyltransferase family protein [Stellaceae bacterium]